jgi:adenine-specific DNA-methyltransferase
MLAVNRIYNMDCIEGIRQTEKSKLIIADPPYYKMVRAEWDNIWKDEKEYYDWCREWIKTCYDNLDDTGSIYIYGGSPYVFEICNIAREIGFIFRNAIVWYFATGQGGTKKYRIEHENILFFTKSDKYTFNSDEIRVPYEAEKPGGGRTHNPLGKTCGTVWRVSRVQRNAKEYTGHPSQKPIELAQRIVTASSNPEDLIIIPFAGSGSETFCSIANNRKVIAFETDGKWFNHTKERINFIS